MKNSDMKAVAIILAIALFFTIVTSNAVSIASVIMLVKDGGTVAANNAGDIQQNGNQQGTTPTNNTPANNGSTNNTPVNNNTNNTPAQPQGGSDTPAQPQGGNDTPAQPQGGNDTPAQPQGGNDTPAAPTSAVDAEAFNFYKAACEDIQKNGSAKFTRKEWQEIEAFNLGGSDALLKLIQGFVTSEADASEKVCEKGSDDSKGKIAPCGSPIDNVASCSRKELPNGNYEVVIVMKDEVTPAKGSNGVAAMSTGILYMEDVKDTIQSNSAVKALVKGLTDDSKITYKAYQITAEMTKDGKFVSIDHYVKGEIVAGAKLIVGSVSGDGVLVFHSKWYDFKY